MKVTLIDSSILTAHGIFDFQPISLEKVRSMVILKEVKSAIKNEVTAEILSILIGIQVEVNKDDFKQEVGETALVFALKSTITKRKVPNRKEIDEIGYEFGVLRRLK